jgi:hypothetical protein
MPFALYEYDNAYQAFFSKTIRTIARARSPLLSQINVTDVSGTLASQVRTREGLDIRLDPGEASTEVSYDLNAVRSGDFDALYAEFDKACDLMAEQLVGVLVSTMSKVTEGTGNVVNAGGQPLSFEVFYEMLEKLEFSLDENDELVMPSMVVHPDTAVKLQALPPLTPEQQSKLDELKQQKTEDALARRRRRRLS